MSQAIPEPIVTMAARLVEIPGIVAVVLGGSRATGQHRADSDFDQIAATASEARALVIETIARLPGTAPASR